MATRTRRKKEQEEENVSFVKSLEFRANRGNKIKTLLDKKEKESDSDDFWKNNKYFGSFNDVMNESEESEDYSQEADVPDVFDEDFDDSDEESEGEEEGEEKKAKGNKVGIGQKSLLQITKNDQADVKKFIEKDEKKRVKPAIAALQKSKAKKLAKAKAEKAQAQAQLQVEETAPTSKAKSKDEMEIEAPPAPVLNITTRPRREIRNVTFAMDTPEKLGKQTQADKAQKAEKLETPQKETATVTFVVKAKGKKGKETKVSLQVVMPKKPSLKKKPEPKAPTKKFVQTVIVPKTEMQVESDSQVRTTRGQEKKAIAIATEKGSMKAPKPKIKPTKNAKTAALKVKTQAPEVEITKKKGKYIHDFYTQEELMKEAALTEIYNKKSLESLLQLETDKKDSYLVVRKNKIDEPKVTFISKKVGDKEEQKIILSNKEAYENYFSQMLHPSTSLKKRPLIIQELDKLEDLDAEEVIKKKLFLTNAQYKLAEINRNIQKMELEEERIEKTINVLRDILEKKQEAL